MGRFMSPDYSEREDDPDPVPYADFNNPQSLNLYSYGGNNPLSQVDSTGHYHCDPDTSSTDPNGVVTVTAGACHADPGDYLRFTLTMMRAEAKAALAARREAMSYLQVGSKNCPNCQIGIVPFGWTGGVATDVAEILTRAGSATGNEGMQVASQALAEQAAKDWVGQGAQAITDRTTGAEVGLKSADGNKIARFTSAVSKGYINLENKLTGSNLHVKW